MKITKSLLLAFLIALSSLSFGFDLTRMAFNSAVKHVAPAFGQNADQSALALPQATGNFGSCQENFANGNPPQVRNMAEHRARALCFNGFAVLHSGTNKTPIYSAEVLNRTRIQQAAGGERTDVFFSDARLPSSERATLEDYSGKNLDRGHLSPAGDMDNPTSMAQSFSLANMIPQASKNNRGTWQKIESDTRKYVKRAQGNVYVITGAVSVAGSCPLKVASSNCTIGNGVVVPSYIYKLVYDATTNRAWAHWVYNSDEASAGTPISYEELVNRTGIVFLPGIRPNV